MSTKKLPPLAKSIYAAIVAGTYNPPRRMRDGIPAPGGNGRAVKALVDRGLVQIVDGVAVAVSA